MNKNQSGFTLVELITTVAIIGLLASIAWPAFERSSMKNRRSVGVTALLRASQELQRCHSDNGGYIDKNGVGCQYTTVSTSAANPNHDYYTISAPVLTTDTFTLKATRKGAQTGDSECGDLTLNHLGQKGYTGTTTSLSRCWSN